MDPRGPTILIVGGGGSSPPVYWSMRRRLLARGAVRVEIAPIWTPDWLIGAAMGFGPLLQRTARAIVHAYRAGGERPVLAIGHSAGGLLLRLAMSPAPFEGRRAGVAEAIAALVTLGTPQIVAGSARRPWQAMHTPAAFLERVTPGAYFAPRTAYLSVASRAVTGAGRGDGRPRHRLARLSYAMFLGPAAREAEGDGIVPLASAHLVGAEQLTFDDVVHSPFGGTIWGPLPWYGEARPLETWWPRAVQLWRGALAERASAGQDVDAHDRQPGREAAAADRLEVLRR